MAEVQTSTWSETAASNTSSPPDGAPEGMAPSGTNDWMREAQAVLKREWNRSHPTVSSSTSTTAFVLTYTTAPTAYAQGLTFAFKAHAASTGSVTLNVNSLGAKKVYRNIGGTATQVASGEWQQNDIIVASYDTSLDSAAGGFWWVNAPATGVPPSVTSTATGALITLTSTDAGASEGPDLDLYRNSASPAASDVIGGIQFNGKDDAGNKQLYARIRAVITDPANTGPSEDGKVVISTTVAGVETDVVTVEQAAAKTGLYVAGNPVTLPLLQTLTASTSASLNFTGADNTKYRGYLCLVHRLLPATDAVNVLFRASTDQGANLRSGTEYDYTNFSWNSGATYGADGSGGASSVQLFAQADNASRGVNGWVQVLLGASAYDCQVNWHLGGVNADGSTVVGYHGYGENNQASVNGFGFLMSSGNITSGTIYVYGIPRV